MLEVREKCDLIHGFQEQDISEWGPAPDSFIGFGDYSRSFLVV